MSTTMFKQKAFNKPGMGKIEFYDTILSAYSEPTAITGFGFTPSTEKIVQQAYMKGMRVETQQRQIAISGQVRFTMREQMAPEAAHIAFGDPNIAQTLTAYSVEPDYVMRTLYNTDVQFVTNEFGLVPNVDLNAPTFTPTVNSAAAGTGWTTGANYLFLLACYGSAANIGSAGAAGWSAIVDKEFTVGAISASSAITIAVATDDVDIAIASYAPDGTVEGPTPDFWAVFVNTSNTIVGATLCDSVVSHAGYGSAVPGTTLVYNIDTPGGASPSSYAAAKGIYVQVPTAGTYATGTMAYTAAVSGTDYTYNSAKGTIKRVSGSTLIKHGTRCRITYWACEPYKVTTAGGSMSTNTNIKKLRYTFLELEVDPVTGEPEVAEGERFTFYQVNLKGSEPEYNYTEDSFSDGANIALDVLYDLDQDKMFDHETWSMKHRRWEMQYS